MDNELPQDRLEELIKTFERMFGEPPTTTDISYLKYIKQRAVCLNQAVPCGAGKVSRL